MTSRGTRLDTKWKRTEEGIWIWTVRERPCDRGQTRAEGLRATRQSARREVAVRGGHGWWLMRHVLSSSWIYVCLCHVFLHQMMHITELEGKSNHLQIENDFCSLHLDSGGQEICFHDVYWREREISHHTVSSKDQSWESSAHSDFPAYSMVGGVVESLRISLESNSCCRHHGVSGVWPRPLLSLPLPAEMPALSSDGGTLVLHPREGLSYSSPIASRGSRPNMSGWDELISWATLLVARGSGEEEQKEEASHKNSRSHIKLAGELGRGWQGTVGQTG